MATKPKPKATGRPVTQPPKAHPAPSPPRGGGEHAYRGASPSQAVVAGIARLVEGMRCFADEFGLARGRVLAEVCDDLQGHRPEDILRGWLRGGEEGAQRIHHLFDALASHQMALVSGLEGVARETVSHFNPQQFQQRAPRVFGLRPGVWRSYCSYYRELVANDHQLHQKLVLPGFLAAYARAREGKCLGHVRPAGKPTKGKRR